MAPAARRALAAAALLGATPLVYAFGTDVVIPFHAAGAAIFWLAALATLVGEASPLASAGLRPGLFALALASALGLMAGVVVTPGPAGPHLWLQTQPTAIGPSGSRIALDPKTAAYYGGLREAAARNGFRPGTMVADFAGLNDGMILVLGGRPAALAVVPRLAREARRPPWVLASPSPGKFVRPVDLAGARFPQDYMLVGLAVHRSKGWTEQLWKPKNG